MRREPYLQRSYHFADQLLWFGSTEIAVGSAAETLTLPGKGPPTASAQILGQESVPTGNVGTLKARDESTNKALVTYGTTRLRAQLVENLPGAGDATSIPG